MRRWLIYFLVWIVGAMPATAANNDITLAVISSTQSMATYLATERGYFKEVGINVRFEEISTSAQAMALVATNKVQVAEGGFAVSYFNAVAQGLPIIMALERGSTPIFHSLIVRPDLKDKIKSIADLKGRSIALGAPATILTYEIGKLLETVGLRFSDIEVKYIPFNSMSAALTNGSVDVVLGVPPYGSLIVETGIGVFMLDPDDYIKPTPYGTNAYFANTDWLRDHPETARKLFLALARGARDYCQAYHHGAIRKQALDLLMKNQSREESSRPILERVPWQARDINGRFNPESVLDIQDWFLKEGFITKKLPIQKLITSEYSDYIAEQLGPFEVENKASTLKGCQ